MYGKHGEIAGVEDNPDLVRDMGSGAVLVKAGTEYDNFKKRRDRDRKSRDRINKLEKENESISAEVRELRSALARIEQMMGK